MVSIQTNQRKENTMQRFFVLLAFAALLTACAPVTPATPAPTPSPTPDPVAAFLALYNALDAPYTVLAAQFAAEDYADPEWRAATVKTATEWRAAIDALQAADGRAVAVGASQPGSGAAAR